MQRFYSANVAIGIVGVAAAIVSIWAAPGAAGILGAILAALMLAIAVTDLCHLIIPNELTFAGVVSAAVNAGLAASGSIIESVALAALRGLVTMLLFFAVRSIYLRLRGREGLGLGDVKLAFVAGAWLDWVMLPVAVEIAAMSALLVYVAWPAAVKHPVDSASRVPFGLFFAPAIWLSWLFGAVFRLN